MLKARGKGQQNGKPIDLVVFGLSYENLRRLKAGQPIFVKGGDIGLPDTKFVIFAGQDERLMGREFAELIGPETNVDIDPKLRD